MPNIPNIPKGVYEWLRWLISIVIPAAIVLYGVIGSTLNIPHTEVVLTIAGAVDTFLGTIFGISKIAYDKKMKGLKNDE